MESQSTTAIPEANMDRRADLALAMITSAFGVVILVLTRQISTVLAVDPIGSRGFGYMIGTGLVLGGAYLAVTRARAWSSHGQDNIIPSDGATDEPDIPASPYRPVIIVGATLAYVSILGTLGFMIATPIYVAGLMYLMKAKRPIVSRLLAPVVFTIVVYLAFDVGLGVNLPMGPLSGIL